MAWYEILGTVFIVFVVVLVYGTLREFLKNRGFNGSWKDINNYLQDINFQKNLNKAFLNSQKVNKYLRLIKIWFKI